MSVTILNTGLTHALQGMADKWDLNQLSSVVIFPVEEDRDYSLCCIKESVLADYSGTIWKNDVKGFMFQVAAPTDTLVMYLQKDTVDVATLNDNTYGTYYAIGGITYYTDQSLLTGYILEWSKVLALNGIGNYRIKIVYTTFSGSTTTYSNNFKLRVYSFENASGTVRIDSYMNGYLMRNRMNYKGLNFPNMIRVRGWFGNSEEKIETTNDIYANYINEKRLVVQRKVQQTDIFNLELHPLPKCIANDIRYYHFLANDIYITDYNILNYDYDLQRKRIYKDEAFVFKYTKTKRNIIIRGKLIEAINDNQKTNC
jgi:hypothetical protein